MLRSPASKTREVSAIQSESDILACENELLSSLAFRYPLRRYQQEIIELVKIKLERGERQLHIVAPPGAGKTIIGLQIISQFKCPSLILSPNTTIQSQWGQKMELFIPPELTGFDSSELLGTHEDKPLKPVTLLTYQVLSTPGREQEYIEKLAHQSWVEELTRGRALSVGDAELRILELLQNNKRAYQTEMSRHASRLRRKLSEVMDLKEVLHENALDLLQALRRQNFKLVIFDECHHLTDYWAAIMTHLVKYLDDPVIVGLTGTPPEGKSSTQENRYLSLVGEIDYQVPTPALVKEGGLAPFQDLVYFTEPTEREFQFLQEQHFEFHELIERLSAPVTKQTDDGAIQADSPLTDWVKQRTAQASIAKPDPVVIEPAGDGAYKASVKKPKAKKTKATAAPPPRKRGWEEFAHENPELAVAYCRYLHKVGAPFPKGAMESEFIRQAPLIDDWMLILEDFASTKLKLSSNKKEHELYEQIRSAARKLGYGITEQGLRRQASPVDRVLAFSKGKPDAVARILDMEYRNLQDRLRAVVVTDFERMSATAVKNLKGVIDEESGGAIATLRTLLASPISEYVNPCLVTGTLLLTDKRVTGQFLEAGRMYLKEEGFDFGLTVHDDPALPFSQITGSSAEWEPRLYVGMATALFERGISKCLIGTRGIFGEGWDSQALNTLIDLTTTTSPVSVKQLRGRSIRLQTNDPLSARKVANNWDVVCIAPQLEKGLNDYYRFVRKHDGYFGICDDGQIECGVGHVHPSLSDLTPVEVFASAEVFNKEMLDRALIREKIYELWKIGEPYHNRSLGCIEISGMRKLALTPPHIRRDMNYKEHAHQLRQALNGVWLEHGAISGAASLISLGLLHAYAMPLFVAILPIIAGVYFGARKYGSLFTRMEKETFQCANQEGAIKDIAYAVLSSLQRIRVVPRSTSKDSIKISVRTDGTYRVFLDDVEPEPSQNFAAAMKEVLAPVSNQPYLIPKYEFALPESEESQKKQFKAYVAGKAQPRVAAYHAVPSLLARSERGRQTFQAAWNKYVSPGFIVATETKPELIDKYFGLGPSLAQRLLWE